MSRSLAGRSVAANSAPATKSWSRASIMTPTSSPWLALEEKGVTIRWAEIHEEDCTLDLADLSRKSPARRNSSP